MTLARWAVRAVALCAASMLAGCATTAPSLTGDQALDENHGAIFGRMRVNSDGDAVESGRIALQFHPFEGPANLLDFDMKAGKWLLSANLDEGGYFSSVVPPGTYYAVVFVTTDVGLQGGRASTYASTIKIKQKRPSLLLFDVQPGQSTYIGDFVHALRANGSEWSVEVRDGELAFRRWFREKYPERAEAIKKLARMGALH
jgi:hypothetical protein